MITRVKTQTMLSDVSALWHLEKAGSDETPEGGLLIIYLDVKARVPPPVPLFFF